MIAPMDTLTRHSAAALITGYQRHISPHKGFSCAYRVLHGSESCSAYIKRSILEQGLIEAISLSRQRFQACKSAHQVLLSRRQTLQATNRSQRRRDRWANDCSSSPDCAGCACDATDCGINSCDGLDCSGVDCNVIDCSVIDCSGVDCCSFG
jgi:putative component of membrane protein insertase Oxa1/YidC/SpoIIIJ protein YidD